jgi:hypothetical protein
VFGRDLTRHCSLAIHDRVPTPAGIHYRSRFDDDEDCWAIDVLLHRATIRTAT